jgi:hypothetical protein
MVEMSSHLTAVTRENIFKDIKHVYIYATAIASHCEPEPCLGSKKPGGTGIITLGK